jgi:hypothetical protein
LDNQDKQPPEPPGSGRDSGGRFAKGHKKYGGRPRGKRNKAARASIASLIEQGVLLPHERLRQIGEDPKTSEPTRVQALQAAAPYYAPKLAPISSIAPPTTIALPPLSDAPSILDAQRLVAEAMAGGRLEMVAGQAIMNSLALMIRSREALVTTSPPTIVIESGALIQDLPVEETDPSYSKPQSGPNPGSATLVPQEMPIKTRAASGKTALRA